VGSSCGSETDSKHFFFGKKKQKTVVSGVDNAAAMRLGSKSFLLLFFKKEVLPSAFASPRPSPYSNPMDFEAPTARAATIARTTSETDIAISLALDGTGRAQLATGIGFFDHMLTAFARHGGFDLTVNAKGDLHIDAHHTVEDVGIVLGAAFRQALGEKRGITRFGHALVPMDEALAEAVVDISGRAHLAWTVPFERETLGTMDTQLFEEFFRAFAGNALITLHITRRAGHNAHHVAEAAFKATARALRMAVALDPRSDITMVPSTKGAL